MRNRSLLAARCLLAQSDLARIGVVWPGLVYTGATLSLLLPGKIGAGAAVALILALVATPGHAHHGVRAHDSVSACTKYAAPAGSDRAGRGTISRPYRTVGRLDRSLHAGQTGCLRRGEYGSASSFTTFSRPNVTIRSAPGEAATIAGAPKVTGEGTTLSHLRFDVDNVNHVLAVGEHCQPLGETTGAFSLDIEASNVTLEYSDVYQNDVPVDKRAVGIGVGWKNSVSGVVIRYNRVHDFGHCRDEDHGMYLDQVDGARIYDNWIYNIPHGAGVQLWSQARGVHIYRNVIDRAAAGFALGGYSSTSDNTIDHNVVSNSVGAAAAGYPNGVAIWTYWLSVEGSNNRFVNNDLFKTTGGGVVGGGSGLGGSGLVASRNLGANPRFRDSVAGDYHVPAGSPVASWGLWDGGTG
jgi:Right handed beta helix region